MIKNKKLISLELDFDNYGMIEYGTRIKNGIKINSIHDGQRKLLIEEMHFLNDYYGKDCVVVYVGAATGHHIPLLADFYPTFTFELYDKTKFAFQPTNRLKQNHKYFDNKEAEMIKKKYKNVLFISDIRNLIVGKYTGEENIDMNDEIILDDLKKQGEWIDIIRPIASSIKFRLPYVKKDLTKFYDGKIYLQPWAPLSTETRLIVTDYTKFKEYNNQEIDQKMYYYNVMIRSQPYKNYEKLIKEKIKLPNNLDITAELMVLEDYLKKSGKYKNENTLVNLHFYITKFLGINRINKIKYLDNTILDKYNFEEIAKSFGKLKPKLIKDIINKSKSSDDLFNSLYTLRKSYTKPERIETIMDEILYQKYS